MKTKLTLFSLRLFFLTCFLWAGDKGLNAQFPVTTQITLPVPHPLSLKDFSGANGQFSLKLKVQLHNIEISDRHFFVRLHLLNNHGLHIQTAPYAPIPPILLEGGFPTELSDLDLEPYFDPENLLFEGISKHQYLRQQQLPQGIYRIYFQIVESLSNKTINNPRAEQRIFPVVLGQPPLLIHPQDQAALPITEPPNILFQWMPRHLAIAGTAGHTTYRFRLVEMLDENISPYIQIHQDLPLLEVEQSATQLFYGIEYPPLLQNQLYAWRVEALVKNPDGSIRPVIQNPEKSQVRTFRYVPPCPPVPPLQIAQEDLQNVSLYWVKQEPHQEYTLSYRMRPKNRKWNKVTTSNSSMLLSDLAQGTVYQYKLEAKCAFAPAPFPQVLTDTTLTMEQAQKIGGCDAPEDLTPKSTIPLKKLLLQETFTTGAGRVHVTRLNSQHSEEGRYSGEGWMYFTPFLPPGAKLAVTFENIFINENRQHVGTEPVVAVRKKSRLDFFTQPTFIEDADPLVIEGQGSRVAGTVTRANFQAGKLVLSTEEGKEIHFKPRKDKPTMVTDDNNAQYVATTTGDIWGTLLSDQGKQEGSEGEGEGEEEQAAAQDTGVQKSDKTSTDKPAPTVQDNFSLKGLEGVHFTISKQTQRFLDNFFQADESFKLYETLLIAGAEYTVPYKLVIVGETDIVRLESNAATKEMLREGKIVFIDPENPTQELTARPNLTLEVAHDNPKKPKSLFALYKKSDKQKIIVGKIIIHAFEQKSKKLYIVPVWEELSWNREEAAKEFQKIYHPAGIAWEVSYLPVLKSVKGLNHRKTVFSSQGLESSEIYSDDMFRVHKAFHKDLEEKQKQEKKEQKEKQETKLDKEGYYLFVVPQGTNGEELGYWPKKRPYGYLFSDKIGGRNSYLLAKHIAHEVGHGVFNLFHTFSEANRYKISSGSTSNLMDYNLSLNRGTYREHQLFQYQWHQIHKPLNITGWIQEQEENKYVSEEDMIKRILESIRIAHFYEDSFILEERENYSTFFLSSVKLRDKKNYKIKIQVHKPGKYPVYYPKGPQATVSQSRTQAEKIQIQVRPKSKEGWHYWDNYLDKTFNIEYGSSSGDPIISITTELGEKQSLLKYLYGSSSSLPFYHLKDSTVIQHKNEALEELDILKECEGKGLLETFPKEYYPDIKIATRKKLIRCLLDEWEVTGEDETLILDLIETTPNSHARSLFDFLNNGTSYMKAFISKLDNHGVFGGKRNFDRFALVWLDLFYRAHTVDELKEKYHKIESNTHRIYHYGHDNFGISCESKVISRVEDDRIIFTEEEITEYFPQSHRLWSIRTDKIDDCTKEQREYSYSLNDLIAVYFAKEEKIAGCTFKGVMLLPVSTYHVIVNSAINDQKVTLLNVGISILSIAIPFDEFVLLGQIMKKAGTSIRTLRTFRAKEFARRIKTATDKQFQGRLPKNADKVVDALKGKSAGKAAKGAEQGFKSFSAFKRAMGPAGHGKAWHHIVEQHADNVAKFGHPSLQNTKNVISIPGGFKGSLHSKVTGHYNSLMPGTSMRVRDYVKTLPYNQQYQYGIDVLKSFGWTP